MSKGITIYSPDNSVIYEMPSIFQNCIEKVTLMSEDYIELKFSLANPIFIDVGSWCEWNGKRYYVTEHQQPTPNTSTGGYDYDVKFNAYYFAWKLRMYKAKVLNVQETEFNYTGNAKAQLEFFIERLSDENFLYNDTEAYEADVETYRSEEDILDEVKTMAFSGVTFIDALNQIASEWDTEWFVVGKKIYLGKCQEKSEGKVSFELYKNVAAISSSQSEQQYATRLYAFGGTQNLPHNWNKGDAEFSVKSILKDGGFKADRDLNTSYWDKKYVTQTYDFVSPFFTPKAVPIENQKNYPISIDAPKKLQLKKGTYKKGTYVFYKKGNEDADDLILSLTFQPNEATDDAGFKPRYTYAKILYSVFLRYNATPISINVTATDDAINYFRLNDSTETTCDVHVKIKDFDIPEDQNDVYFDISMFVSFYSNYVPDTSGGISPLVTNYTGVVKVDTESEMRLRTSDYYNNVATRLAFLDNEGKEGTEYRATFTTKNSLFAFYFNDLNAPTIEVGDKFYIKNILNSKLPSYYFPANKQDTGVIKAMAETRLCLPENGYIQSENDSLCIVEKSVTFDDVFPSIRTAITAVQTEKRNVMDGTTMTGETYDEYRILQDKFTFDNAYKLPDVDSLQIVFQSGALSGLTFDTEFITNESASDKNYFIVKRKQFDGGLYLPSTAMYPKVGDEFILTGWDVSRIEDLGLVADAQERLAERAQNELKNMNTDPTTYECTMYSDMMYQNAPSEFIVDENGSVLVDSEGKLIKTDKKIGDAKGISYELGQRVRLISEAFFKEGFRDSRILGYERKMDIPWDSPVYSVGEKAIYSKIKDLQKQIDKKNANT